MNSLVLDIERTHRDAPGGDVAQWFLVGRHLARREASPDEGALEFFLDFYRKCWAGEFEEAEFAAGWLDMRGEHVYAANARG